MCGHVYQIVEFTEPMRDIKNNRIGLTVPLDLTYHYYYQNDIIVIKQYLSDGIHS